LLDIKECCAPSSNSILASLHRPCTQTGAIAVFSMQTGLLISLVVESSGMVAAIKAFGFPAFLSVLVVSDGFGLEI